MKKMNAIDWIALVLLIVGGLNWGLVGILKLDLVDKILGSIPVLATIVYVLVGLSAVYVLVGALAKKDK